MHPRGSPANNRQEGAASDTTPAPAPRVYRVPHILPAIGLAGVAFFSYALACDWFPSLCRFRIRNVGFTPGEEISMAVMMLGGFYLIASTRMRVVLDEHGVHCAGVFRKRFIPWEDVRTVVVPRRGMDMLVETVGRRLRLLRLAGTDGGFLTADLPAYARRLAPHARIDCPE